MSGAEMAVTGAVLAPRTTAESEATPRIGDHAAGVRLMANFIRYRVVLPRSDSDVVDTPAPTRPGSTADENRGITLLRGQQAGMVSREHWVRVNSATLTAIGREGGWTYLLTAKHTLLPKRRSRAFKKIQNGARDALAQRTGLAPSLIFPVGTLTAVIESGPSEESRPVGDLETVCVSERDDLVLMRTRATWEFTPPEVGDSSLLEYGDEIYLYGYHHGEAQLQLTKGIVSRPPCRAAECPEEARRRFGTDAKANPALSGGPVFWRDPKSSRLFLVGILLGGHSEYLEPLHEALAIDRALAPLGRQETPAASLLQAALRHGNTRGGGPGGG